ncbi:MAG: PH domain-containing protein, partial [Verrucomicrobiota bacterium]
RVRDLQVIQPFFQRLFGLQTLRFITSDSSTPEVVLDHLPANLALADKFRENIEKCRQQKRVREVDIE